MLERNQRAFSGGGPPAPTLNAYGTGARAYTGAVGTDLRPKAYPRGDRKRAYAPLWAARPTCPGREVRPSCRNFANCPTAASLKIRGGGDRG